MQKVLYIFLAFHLFSCSSLKHKKENILLFSMIIDQNGSPCEVYTVNVFQNKTMTVKYGELEFGQEKYLEIFEEKSVKLTISEFKKLSQISNQIALMDEIQIESFEKGAWSIHLKLKDKTYNYYRSEQKYLILLELLDEIKKLTPIKLDFHWGGCP